MSYVNKIVDKFYIIQTGKNKHIRTSLHSEAIHWIAHNPCRNVPCVDRFIKLASLRPHLVFRNDDPLTINYVGKVCDMIDILRHAIRKKFNCILIYRPYIISKQIKIVNISLKMGQCIYKLHESMDYLDGSIIFNHQHFFNKLLVILQESFSSNDLTRKIDTITVTEQYSSQYHLQEHDQQTKICLPVREQQQVQVNYQNF